MQIQSQNRFVKIILFLLLYILIEINHFFMILIIVWMNSDIINSNSSFMFWVNDNSLYEILLLALFIPQTIIYTVVLTVFKYIFKKFGLSNILKFLISAFIVNFVVFAVSYPIVDMYMIPSILLLGALASPLDVVVSNAYDEWFGFSILTSFILVQFTSLYSAFVITKKLVMLRNRKSELTQPQTLTERTE